jgi:hypothetical protein
MLAALLGLIPGLSSLVAGVSKAYFDQKVRIYQAKTGATRDVAVAAIQASGSIATRWWFVAAIIPLWAFPFIVMDWKIVLYDVLWMNGQASTPALRGTLDWVHVTIVASLFVHGVVDTFTRNTKS